MSLDPAGRLWPETVTILVGAQWGDEGKGKWIDVLAERADLAVRYQGGNNAGHTLYVNGEKIVLHQLPSGVFHKSQTSALAAGVVVNPVQLVKEIDGLGSRVSLPAERLWLSGRAHVITPWHVHLDEQREANAKVPIGTTKRGIGPTYSEKASRSGLRLGAFVDDEQRRQWISRMTESSPDGAFKRHFDENQPAWSEFQAAAKRLRAYVCDAESKIRGAARSGWRILLEGAQGTMLDLDHGTYPYVTSSSTGAGGAVASIGLSPKLVGRVIGIAKAYVTRVGEGPFPTELKNDVGNEIARRGHEFGATTGRPRRVGWMDAVALRYVAEVNGLDGVVLNKMDILTGIGDVGICVAYEHPRLGRLEEFPWDTSVLAEVKPIYEMFPGWTDVIPTRGHFHQLPANARRFVEAIEARARVKVLAVGTGPKREEALYP